MVYKIDVMLGENHRLVQDEKSEDHPEIRVQIRPTLSSWKIATDVRPSENT